jgi:DNA repair exonuclease SbcCD ATPase subunit|tara:strand:+ start:3309 stop:5021 length:1713 start_codon:yes stop_codon:yes gene_type:complete
MIQFKKVRFKNFGSFGNNFTEVNLDTGGNTLVSGNNGHGKSFALLDSVTFALFGRPFRSIKVNQIVNSINQKDCVVECEFQISDDVYLIRRGIKPKIFEVFKNGELIDQHAKAKDYQNMLEEQIIKMNYKSFTQVVILGSSSFVPFMQMSPGDRRTVIEDILDIQVFSEMNSLLKTRLAENKEQLLDAHRELGLVKEKILIQQTNLDSLRKKGDAERERVQSEIDTTREQIKELQEQGMDLAKKVKELNDTAPNLSELRESLKNANSKHAKLTQQKLDNESLTHFYNENTECPSCRQEITNETRESLLIPVEQQHKELQVALDEVGVIITEQEDAIDSAMKVHDGIAKLTGEMDRLGTELRSRNKYIDQCNKQIEACNTAGDTEETEARIEKLNGDESALSKTKEDLLDEGVIYSHASNLLKDTGIKARIIKTYLPVMNQLINKYLGDMDFFAQFNLDENFSETIKSRHRDDFSYSSFSEGEKLRIDLALLLAWREIARLKNSANTNLLILDEVFDSSLDAGGTEEFLKLLDILSERCNIFVISHKADQLADKFSKSMTFEKRGNFSRIV